MVARKARCRPSTRGPASGGPARGPATHRPHMPPATARGSARCLRPGQLSAYSATCQLWQHVYCGQVYVPVVSEAGVSKLWYSFGRVAGCVHGLRVAGPHQISPYISVSECVAGSSSSLAPLTPCVCVCVCVTDLTGRPPLSLAAALRPSPRHLRGPRHRTNTSTHLPPACPVFTALHTPHSTSPSSPAGCRPIWTK